MSAIPQELLGLRVEVVRSIRRTAALHIVGSALQVRVPAQLGDERVAAILQQKRPWISSKVAQRQQLPPHRPRELVSLAYFPSQDGKRLKPGQTVRVTPTTTRAQRHGGISGRILSLRPLPVSREGLRQRLGLESLVATVQTPGGDGNQPLIEAVTSLQRDPRTKSGFDWGGGPGPNLTLSPGTGTEVSVLVEYRQPISYVIPLLRDISGIY